MVPTHGWAVVLALPCFFLALRFFHDAKSSRIAARNAQQRADTTHVDFEKMNLPAQAGVWYLDFYLFICGGLLFSIAALGLLVWGFSLLFPGG
jgi:hypothetical protein